MFLYYVRNKRSSTLIISFLFIMHHGVQSVPHNKNILKRPNSTVCYHVIYTKSICNFNFSPPKHFSCLNRLTWKTKIFRSWESSKTILRLEWVN